MPCSRHRCRRFLRSLLWSAVASSWFLPPHFAHFAPHGACALTQNLHVLRDLVFGSSSRLFFDQSESWRFGGWCLSFTQWTSSLWASEIVFNCALVASELLHRSIHVFSVRFLSCRIRWRVCLSWMPRTILLRMCKSCMQSQKYHVFASVRRMVTWASIDDVDIRCLLDFWSLNRTFRRSRSTLRLWIGRTFR